MTRVIVYHSGYGCGTGCCGHVVEMDGVIRNVFRFAHPYEERSARAFAEEMVRDAFGDDHVADLDWEGCVIVDD